MNKAKNKTKKLKKGGQMNLMKISYPSFSLKNTNTISTIEETVSEPTIILPKLGLSTLIMHDPDSSQPSWLHYLVVNIPNGNISKGNVIVDYNGPSPPSGSGIHRYIFEVYSQSEKIPTIKVERSGFSPLNFANEYNLKFIKKQMFKVNS